jgi:hypothetical protein
LTACLRRERTGEQPKCQQHETRAKQIPFLDPPPQATDRPKDSFTSFGARYPLLHGNPVLMDSPHLGWQLVRAEYLLYAVSDSVPFFEIKDSRK